MRYYKSFSIIEIIFTILIISIFSTVAIGKLFHSSSKTILIKAKTDLALIQNGLENYKRKMVLQNQTNSLNSLETNSQYLFSNILTTPFIASTQVGAWSKYSDKQYRFWIDKNRYIKFRFNKYKLTFDCDKTDNLCQEVLK